jgi:hypothetical protein
MVVQSSHTISVAAIGCIIVELCGRYQAIITEEFLSVGLFIKKRHLKNLMGVTLTLLQGYKG